MEQSYSYNSYPDSGDSSPRSPSWENQNQNQNMNYKVKLMCSYGGKILPRPHDNQLCYTGGETKIFSFDRTARFSAVISRLSSLCGGDHNVDVSFKYQLPGEDLDALISVTNDDDLDHMMHEYDRLYRASSSKPARMRIFLFLPPQLNHTDSFNSDVSSRSDRDHFVEALNSGPAQPPDLIPKPPAGWAKPVAVEVSPPPPPAVPELQIRTGLVDRVVGSSDPTLNPVEFQRLQIGDHHQPSDNSQYRRRKSDDDMIGVYNAAGDYYKVPENPHPATMPPQQNSAPVGYWPEKNVASVGYPATTMAGPPEQEPMYMNMIGGTGGGGVYHAPMMQSATGPTGQGYYQMQQQHQRMASDVYRDQAAAYNNNVLLQQQHMMSSNLPPKSYVAATYAETTPYAQMAYYTTAAAGGVVQQPQPQPQPQPQQQMYSAVGPAAVNGGELRGVAGGLSQDGKMVGSRVPRTSL